MRPGVTSAPPALSIWASTMWSMTPGMLWGRSAAGPTHAMIPSCMTMAALLMSSTPVHSRPMFVSSRTVIVSPLARPRRHGRHPMSGGRPRRTNSPHTTSYRCLGLVGGQRGRNGAGQQHLTLVKATVVHRALRCTPLRPNSKRRNLRGGSAVFVPLGRYCASLPRDGGVLVQLACQQRGDPGVQGGALAGVLLAEDPALLVDPGDQDAPDVGQQQGDRDR